jgi:hypothetical protein
MRPARKMFKRTAHRKSSILFLLAKHRGAVERVFFFKNRLKLGDRKCPSDLRLADPNAILFSAIVLGRNSSTTTGRVSTCGASATHYPPIALTLLFLRLQDQSSEVDSRVLKRKSPHAAHCALSQLGPSLSLRVKARRVPNLAFTS